MRYPLNKLCITTCLLNNPVQGYQATINQSNFLDRGKYLDKYGGNTKMGSELQLIWGVIFGGIGLGFFMYGKNQKSAIPFATAIALFIVRISSLT